MGNGVARETEIKLKIDDVKAFRRQLKKLGAKPVRAGDGRVHEENVIFDTPQGGLAKHGQLLRIRTETPDGGGNSKKAKANPRVVLTFKRPIARPTASDAEASSRCTWFLPKRPQLHRSSAKKTEKKWLEHDSALDFAIHAAYQCVVDHKTATNVHGSSR